MACRLKELKRVFQKFCVRKQFRFQTSALKLFEMDHLVLESETPPDHFWYPLKPKDLWASFVHCMMTILDEIHDIRKYDHILLVEYYEWIARVAFRHADLKKAELSLHDQKITDVFRHEQVRDFLDLLLDRVNDGKKRK